jgi:hypothetical protein
MSIEIARISFGLAAVDAEAGAQHLAAQRVVLQVAQDAAEVLGVVGQLGEAAAP